MSNLMGKIEVLTINLVWIWQHKKRSIYNSDRCGVQFGSCEREIEATHRSTQDMSINSWVLFEWRCIENCNLEVMLWFKMMNSRGACELCNVSWGTHNCEYSYKLTTSNIGKFLSWLLYRIKIESIFYGMVNMDTSRHNL